MEDRFNCTFSLFQNSTNILPTNDLSECLIKDITSKGEFSFHDVIKDIRTGKYDKNKMY